MQNVEILFGSSWYEGRMGERIRVEAGEGDRRIDFSAILDTIDILIGGANVSASAREDAVFLMLRDMLAGCEELASGRAHRHVLPFYESPWELVINREGSQALLSFFRGGMNPLIEIKDRPVAFRDLVEALIVAGDMLVGKLESLNPKIMANPFIGEILGALERLRSAELTTRPAPAIEPLDLSFDAAGESEVAFAYTLSATGRDLLGATAANRADLYSLMARGKLECVAQGRVILSAAGHVFFMIESLLLMARHLLGCLEERSDLDLDLHGDALCSEARYDASAESLTVTLTDSRSSSTQAVLSGIQLVLFVDAVLAVARDFKRQVLDVNPSQRTNLKFELFAAEVETLATWRRDLTDSTVVNTGRTLLRYEVPRPTLPRRWDSGRLLMARRLMYAKRWEVEAEGLRLDATFLCGDRIAICTRSLISALDRDTGDPQWQRPGLSGRSLALMTGETGLLTVSPSGEVTLIDIGSGRSLWTTRITPPPGKPTGVTAGGGRQPRYAVLTSEESGLVAVDLFTGDVRWRFRTRRGIPSGFGRFGRLIVLTCRSNSVYCLDADSGDLVWRFSERSRFDLPPVCLREAVAVWSAEQEGRRGRLFILDSFTGEPMWSARAEGRPLAPPVLVGGHVVMALGSPGWISLEAWTAAGGEPGWNRGFDALDGPVALMAMDDAVLVHTAHGAVMSLEGKSGQVRWMHQLTESSGVELPLSLEPVLRDGGLFVPFDTTYVLNPMDGSLLHRLEGDSPVPDLLRVDERYSIYAAEVSGHVSAYGVVGHLDIVKN